MDPNIKQSIIARLKQTNNVLITVKKNPTVDHLAACIGLTLFLNKQGKHATAVFSGEVPSTIEFLKPEATLEKDTNSLRDFIIALDKSKADKLRYKVEDKVVKIYITPYKTSLSESDLDFSQGDFNVDVVIALGVHAREELDQAIMAHGRILHDATIISMNTTKSADLGALNWHDTKASSLSEMAASLADGLQPNSLDEQMATAFLTGIVAETARFSNNKTTSLTMSLSAKLMAAGANQQLVATKLQEPERPPAPTATEGEKPKGNGELDIDHPKQAEAPPKVDDGKIQDKPPEELPMPIAKEGEDDDAIHIDEDGNLKVGLQDQPEENKEEKKEETKPSRLATEPPTMGGTLTGSTNDKDPTPSVNPLSSSPSGTTLEHKETGVNSGDKNKKAPTLHPESQTLSSIEEQVHSPHVQEKSETNVHNDGVNPLQPANAIEVPASSIEDAKKAVEDAAHSNIQAGPAPGQAPSPADINLPPLSSTQKEPDIGPSVPSEEDGGPSNSPPPVPPPMMPPSFTPPNQ